MSEEGKFKVSSNRWDTDWGDELLNVVLYYEGQWVFNKQVSTIEDGECEFTISEDQKTLLVKITKGGGTCSQEEHCISDLLAASGIHAM